MTVDEIRELINLAAETGIAELEVQRGENRVRIRRAAFAAPQEFVHSAPASAAPPPPPSEAPQAASPPTPT
jgi:acetyl-CoA carboxylase biotin carboxyl carrier protein